MSGDHTPLDELITRMRPYDGRMPSHMPPTLGSNVWRTLAIEFVLLGPVAVTPQAFWQLRIQRDDFFQIQALIDLGNGVLAFAYGLAPYFMVLNLLSLLLALIIATVSFGMRRPVRRLIPWLATINLIPGGLSIGVAVVVLLIISLIIVAHMILLVVQLIFNIALLLIIGLGLWLVGRTIRGGRR